ncbi:MAG: septum formation initiator family protein [Spirochaetia bacterium]|nr:septum formation initiator family protein [Spirochaetia bacterium]
MKIVKFIITASYLSLFIFLSASLIWGDTSYQAYNELATYKEQLAANVQELENINNNLKQQCLALGSTEEMLLQARSLGLVSRKEKVIIIDNATYGVFSYDLGGRYSSNIKDYNRIININNLRIFSAAIAIVLTMLIYSFSGLNHGNKNRKSRASENSIPDIAE